MTQDGRCCVLGRKFMGWGRRVGCVRAAVRQTECVELLRGTLEGGDGGGWAAGDRRSQRLLQHLTELRKVLLLAFEVESRQRKVYCRKSGTQQGQVATSVAGVRACVIHTHMGESMGELIARTDTFTAELEGCIAGGRGADSDGPGLASQAWDECLVVHEHVVTAAGQAKHAGGCLERAGKW